MFKSKLFNLVSVGINERFNALSGGLHQLKKELFILYIEKYIGDQENTFILSIQSKSAQELCDFATETFLKNESGTLEKFAELMTPYVAAYLSREENPPEGWIRLLWKRTGKFPELQAVLWSGPLSDFKDQHVQNFKMEEVTPGVGTVKRWFEKFVEGKWIEISDPRA